MWIRKHIVGGPEAGEQPLLEARIAKEVPPLALSHYTGPGKVCELTGENASPPDLMSHRVLHSIAARRIQVPVVSVMAALLILSASDTCHTEGWFVSLAHTSISSLSA